MGPYPSFSIYQRPYARALLAASALALVLLYIGKLIPASNLWLNAIEEEASRDFNAMLGRRSVYDWSVILTSTDRWILLSILAGLISIFVEGWFTRGRHYGRLFGYALFAIILTMLTEEAGDKISDLVEHRDSPWVVLDGLTDLRKSYDDEAIEMPEECGFPDENVMGWSCLVALLFLRAPRTSMLTLATLMIYLGAHLAMGTRWLLDMLTAAAAGPALGAAALIAFERPLHWLERKSEEGFLFTFWRSLAESERLRRPPHDASQAAGVIYRKPRIVERQHREHYWHRLVRREVLPALNIPADRYRLLHSPPGGQLQAFRASPYVRFLVSANKEVIIVKAAWRLGGFFYRRGRTARYALSAKYNVALERLGLPVPRLYWSKEGVTHLGLRRYCLLVEEFIDGWPVETSNPNEVIAAMRVLARLHGHTRESWGNLLDTRPHARGQFIWQELRPRVYVALREFGRWYDRAWTADHSHQIWKLIESEAARILDDSTVTFRLTHGDVTPRNFLVSGEDIVLVDLITLRFDLCGAEIIKAAIGLAHLQGDLRHLAWQTYFEAAGEERWREFRKQSRLALMVYLLRELAHLRAGGLREGEKPADPAQIVRWLESISAACEESWGDLPADADWQKISTFFQQPIEAALTEPAL